MSLFFGGSVSTTNNEGKKCYECKKCGGKLVKHTSTRASCGFLGLGAGGQSTFIEYKCYKCYKK